MSVFAKIFRGGRGKERGTRQVLADCESDHLGRKIIVNSDHLKQVGKLIAEFEPTNSQSPDFTEESVNNQQIREKISGIKSEIQKGEADFRPLLVVAISLSDEPFPDSPELTIRSVFDSDVAIFDIYLDKEESKLPKVLDFYQQFGTASYLYLYLINRKVCATPDYSEELKRLGL